MELLWVLFDATQQLQILSLCQDVCQYKCSGKSESYSSR
jgi:hypothetical protein